MSPLPKRAAASESVNLDEAPRLSRRIGGDVAPGEPILTVTDLSVNFWVNREWFTAAENERVEHVLGELGLRTR